MKLSWKGLATTAALSAAGFVAFAVFLVMFTPRMSDPLRPDGRATWQSHDALAAAVNGKTPDEVKKAFGPPDHAWKDAWKDGVAEWTYYNAIWNKATERRDQNARIVFRGGKADAPKP